MTVRQLSGPTTAPKDLTVAGLGPITRTEAWGHSFFAGPREQAIAAQLKGTYQSNSVGGGQMLNSAPGFIISKGPFSPSTGGSAWRQAGELRPQVCPIMWGINDLAWLNPTSGNLVYWKNCLTAFLRAIGTAPGDHHDAADAALAFDGRWSSTTTAPAGTYKYTNNGADATFTWTSPAGFIGGDVGFLLWTSTRGNGGIYSFTVNGVAAGSVDTRDLVAPDPYPTTSAIAIPSFRLIPGSGQTIVCTVTGSSVVGLAFCHGWILEDGRGPIIPVVLTPRAWSYAVLVGGRVPVDADVAALNVATQAAVDAFGNARVYTVDLDPLLYHGVSLLSAEGLHTAAPLGSQTLVSAIVQSVIKHPLVLSQIQLPVS